MTTARQRQSEEAKNNIRDAIRDCGPDGKATLEIISIERRPSSSGISDYIEVRVLRIGDDGRPAPVEWLTLNLCTAMGYRFNARREAISMGGYGYCRATQIADDITRTFGHPIRVESVNFFAGPRGWHPSKDWKPKP